MPGSEDESSDAERPAAVRAGHRAPGTGHAFLPRRQGILFVLSSPSGAGKDTILEQFLLEDTGVQKCVTATTRRKRPEELDGRDYHFWSLEEFERRRAAGDLLESALVYGNHYGTPRRWVEERLHRGEDVILKIDVQGGLAVKAQFPEAVMVFVMPPSLEVMEERLRGRGSEDEAQIQRRLQDANQELAQRRQYDYIIVNDLLQTAVEQLVAIVTAERCRASRVVAGSLGEQSEPG